jgi:prevent-host-death family protein
MRAKAERITATEFKARCLKMLDELKPQGIIVTKRGRPIARLTPIRNADNSRQIGALKGKIKVKGNIFSTGIRWNAQP